MSQKMEYFAAVEDFLVGGCDEITNEELFDFEPDKVVEPQEREVGTLTPELRRLFVLMHKQQDKAQQCEQEIGNAMLQHIVRIPMSESEARRIVVAMGELHAQMRKQMELFAFLKVFFRVSVCELYNVHSLDIAVRRGWKVVADPDPRLDPQSKMNQHVIGILTAKAPLAIVVGDDGNGGLEIVGLAGAVEDSQTDDQPEESGVDDWLNNVEDEINDEPLN